MQDMELPVSSSEDCLMKQVLETYLNQYTIGYLSAEDEAAMINIIRRNLDSFEEAGSVLASTFRRLENLYDVYSEEGSAFFIVKDNAADTLVGGAGLGPLAGLPASDGIGEVRELVIEKGYRNKGIGGRLLTHCLIRAKELGYQRIYLETTPQMEHAQKLFKSFGFRPVTDQNARRKADGSHAMPCYFMLESFPKLPSTSSEEP